MSDNKFEYAYSAPTEKERKEIESILREYSPQNKATTDKMTRLRALDKKVKLFPTVIAWLMGVIGLLTFGGGFSLIIEREMYAVGVPVSVVGLALVICAYPVHNILVKRGKAKYGEEIVALSKELLSAEDEKTAQ